MARVYELPTHLQVDDNLLLGLSARQLVRLAVGASVAYQLWDISPALPAGVRFGLAAVLALSGVLLALLQPGGRPLDQWVLAFVMFYVLPRRRLWRLSASSDFAATERDGWAELAVDPDWLADVAEPNAVSGSLHVPEERP